MLPGRPPARPPCPAQPAGRRTCGRTRTHSGQSASQVGRISPVPACRRSPGFEPCIPTLRFSTHFLQASSAANTPCMAFTAPAAALASRPCLQSEMRTPGLMANGRDTTQRRRGPPCTPTKCPQTLHSSPLVSGCCRLLLEAQRLPAPACLPARDCLSQQLTSSLIHQPTQLTNHSPHAPRPPCTRPCPAPGVRAYGHVCIVNGKIVQS